MQKKHKKYNSLMEIDEIKMMISEILFKYILWGDLQEFWEAFLRENCAKIVDNYY
jgi:hypothetical protein